VTIYVLIPTYNEAQNIELLARNLFNTLPLKNTFFVFVDDCSSDDTLLLIGNHFNLYPNLAIIEKKTNKGPGDSFNIGFNWILSHSKSDDDIIVTMEADNTSDIELLNKMISISLLGYDLVLASVYAQGGGFSKTSFLRKFISFFANIIFRSIFNIKILTLSSFYRIYSISLLKNIESKYSIILSENGFICMLEILLKAISLNAKIIEVPMLLKSDLRKGKSKMKIIKTTGSYLKFLIKNHNKFK
jgi:dolichol-phosphate mannosyltransferase